jgi:hypothetical protein
VDAHPPLQDRKTEEKGVARVSGVNVEVAEENLLRRRFGVLHRADPDLGLAGGASGNRVRGNGDLGDGSRTPMAAEPAPGHSPDHDDRSHGQRDRSNQQSNDCATKHVCSLTWMIQEPDVCGATIRIGARGVGIKPRICEAPTRRIWHNRAASFVKLSPRGIF